jgi:hypothetical protein
MDQALKGGRGLSIKSQESCCPTNLEQELVLALLEGLELGLKDVSHLGQEDQGQVGEDPLKDAV